MQFSIDKAKTAAVIIIALLMASIALIAMPVQPIQPVQAQLGTIGNSPSTIVGYPNLATSPPAGVTPAYSYPTAAYMSITPNPIGVGQQLLFNVWTTPGSVTYFYRAGYKVTLQKPDGTTEVVGPFNSYFGDCTAWFQYVVAQVGTWKAKFEFPGTYLAPGNYSSNPGVATAGNYTLGASVYWLPSSTDWQEFTVQQEWINSWPLISLPTDYWMRPATVEHREWWSILGNYPFTGAYYYPGGRVLYRANYRYTAYVQAPNTAHIVWRRSNAISGIIGGQAYYYAGYSGGGTPDIIYAGRCYDTLTKVKTILVNGTYYDQPTTVWECYDLRTGQVYWDIQGYSVTPTAIVYESPTASADLEMAASGTYSVSLVAISGSRLYKFNPLTGAVTLNISIAPISSGTIWNNELVYSVQNLGTTVPIEQRYRLINWTMKGSTTNFTARIGSNITWPTSSLPATTDFDSGLAVSGGAFFMGTGAWTLGYNITGYDILTGQRLYSIGDNATGPNGQDYQIATNFDRLCYRGKYAIQVDNRHWNCFDARTGKLLWMSDKADYPWGVWWSYSVQSMDINESTSIIVGTTYDGVYAIDWDTGHILWSYHDPAPPFESPYGVYSIYSGVQEADGKIYVTNTEHTTTYPVTRGWGMFCLNATNGKLLWRVTGDMSPGAIADGYLTASCPSDGYMYVFGKGKSATTVAAPDTAVALGTAVLIHGTVMDMSPGDQGSVANPTARLDSPTAPGTVPCVSATSMSTLMNYLYLQRPITGLWGNETITGVPVILTAIGSDGSVYNIGTTTTNGYYGTFGLSWTPPKEDTYTIMATFAGDDSYGSSATATSLVVGPAPASPTPTATPPEVAPDNTGLIYATLAAVIVAIIIGIVAVLVGLRKRQ